MNASTGASVAGPSMTPTGHCSAPPRAAGWTPAGSRLSGRSVTVASGNRTRVASATRSRNSASGPPSCCRSRELQNRELPSPFGRWRRYRPGSATRSDRPSSPYGPASRIAVCLAGLAGLPPPRPDAPAGETPCPRRSADAAGASRQSDPVGLIRLSPIHRCWPRTYWRAYRVKPSRRTAISWYWFGTSAGRASASTAALPVDSASRPDGSRCSCPSWVCPCSSRFTRPVAAQDPVEVIGVAEVLVVQHRAAHDVVMHGREP